MAFMKGSVGMQLGQFDKRFNVTARSMFESKSAQKQLKYQLLILALALPGGVFAAPHSGDSHASVADQVIVLLQCEYFPEIFELINIQNLIQKLLQ